MRNKMQNVKDDLDVLSWKQTPLFVISEKIEAPRGKKKAGQISKLSLEMGFGNEEPKENIRL